jgi:hypothetical protein
MMTNFTNGLGLPWTNYSSSTNLAFNKVCVNSTNNRQWGWNYPYLIGGPYTNIAMTLAINMVQTCIVDPVSPAPSSAIDLRGILTLALFALSILFY